MFDFGHLPPSEDDRTEYKSSQVAFQGLKEDVARAASTFWNSGGGTLVVGVDAAGKPDGGIDSLVGRQALKDWLDQILHQIEPAGRYEILRPVGTTPCVTPQVLAACP